MRFTIFTVLMLAACGGSVEDQMLKEMADQRKEGSEVAQMKNDLRNLVIAQETFWQANNDYAGAIGAAQINGKAGAGTVAFKPTAGKLTLKYVAAEAWSATITHRDKTCSIFVGDAAALYPGATEGAPTCH